MLRDRHDKRIDAFMTRLQAVFLYQDIQIRMQSFQLATDAQIYNKSTARVLNAQRQGLKRVQTYECPPHLYTHSYLGKISDIILMVFTSLQYTMSNCRSIVDISLSSMQTLHNLILCMLISQCFKFHISSAYILHDDININD